MWMRMRVVRGASDKRLVLRVQTKIRVVGGHFYEGST